MENLNYKESKHFEGFKIVKEKSGKYRIIFGIFAVTKKTFDSIKQAEEYIGSKPYELIINTFLAILENEKINNPAKEIAENEETAENNSK